MRKTLFLFAIIVSILLIGTSVQADTSLKDRITTFFELSNFDLGIGWSNYIGSNSEGTSIRNTSPVIHARYGNLWGLNAAYEEVEYITGGQHGHDLGLLDIFLDRQFRFKHDQVVLSVGGGWSHPMVHEKEASRESLALLMNAYYFGDIEGYPWWPDYTLKMDDTFYASLGLDAVMANDVLIFDEIKFGLDLAYRVYRTSIVGTNGRDCHKWGGNTNGTKAELTVMFTF